MIGVIFKNVKGEIVLKSLVTQESIVSQLPQIGDHIDFGEDGGGEKKVLKRTFLYKGKKKEVRDIEIQVG